MMPSIFDETLLNLWLNTSSRREFLEMGVAHAVASAPAEGIAIACGMGMTPDLIESRMDLRLIYCACLVVHPHGKRNVFKLARRALQEDHYWDDDAHENNWGPRWSNAGLGNFFTDFAEFPSPMLKHALGEYIAQLVRIHRSQRDAVEHYEHACRLLESEVAA